MSDLEAERLRIYALQDGAIRAQALTFALTAGIFDYLSPGPASFERLSTDLGISPRVLPALMAFLVSNRLIDVTPDGYTNTPATSAFLVRNSSTFVGGRSLLFAGFYDAIKHLPEALRSGEPWTPEGQHDMFAGFTAEQRQWFADGMSANAARGAFILLEHVDFGGFRSLLDVGGSTGGYAIPIARRASDIEISILDLPALRELAQARIADAGLTGRVAFRPGSFFEPISGTYDCVLLSSILHDWDDSDCARILDRCHTVLKAGGTIVVTEPMLAEDFSGPDHPAASGLTMALLGGQNRTRSQIREMLEASGFNEVWMSDLLPQNSIVTGRRIP